MNIQEALETGYSYSIEKFLHYLRIDYSIKKVISLSWLLTLGYIEDYDIFNYEYIVVTIDSDGENKEYTEEMLNDIFEAVYDAISEGLE